MPSSEPRPEDLAHLREDLGRLGGVAGSLGEGAAAALAREQRVPGLLAARGSDEPEAVVARLFPLGDTVAVSEVDAAFPTVGVDGLLRLGLVVRDVDEVRAVVDLTQVETEEGTLWFTSDLGERVTGRAVSPDHVLGVGGASLTLAGITDRTPVGSALDLGTGCGIQAGLLARHVDDVVATDLSTRARRFARFNAALNGQTWDIREGSMLAPVVGEKFDLIVSNPPFVITPAAAYEAGLPHMEYRDAGVSSDRLLTELLGGVGAHLTDAGRVQVLANWEHRAEESWQERLSGLLTDDLDAWVMERELLDPAEYVEMWLRDGGFTADADGRARSEAVYAAWLSDFAARGVEAVGFGYIVLGKRSSAGASIGDVADERHGGTASARPAPPLRRFERVTSAAQQPLGAHLRGCFDAMRRGEVRPDWRVVIAEDVTVEHHFLPGAEEPEAMLLRQGGGFGRTMQLDTALADLLDAPAAELWASLARDVEELLAGGFVRLA